MDCHLIERSDKARAVSRHLHQRQALAIIHLGRTCQLDQVGNGVLQTLSPVPPPTDRNNNILVIPKVQAWIFNKIFFLRAGGTQRKCL